MEYACRVSPSSGGITESGRSPGAPGRSSHTPRDTAPPSPESAIWTDGQSACSADLAWMRGQPKPKARAAELRVAKLYTTTRLLEERANDGEPDAAALSCRGMPAPAICEHRAPLGGRDPRPIIVDGEENHAVDVRGAADANPAPQRAVLHGILEQVDQDSNE